MSSLCNTKGKSTYETCRIAGDGYHVCRPGGLQLTARAVALAGLGAGATILDLGCGSGDSVRYLLSLGLDAIGIDCEPRSKTSTDPVISTTNYVVASSDNLPFPNDSVEGVLAECSLSLMEAQDRVLAECARVLKGGGRLIISDLYARQPDAIDHIRARRGSCISGMVLREELEARLVLHGFTVDLWEDHSQALRESAARFIFEHGSLEGLWNCKTEDDAEANQTAMRAARAGYFLLIATRNRQSSQENS